MFLSFENIGHGQLADIPPMSFALLGRERAPALILAEDDRKYAIFLGGSVGELVGFESSENLHWAGAYLPNVTVELEFDSFSSDESGSFGQIRVEDGVVYLIFNQLHAGSRQSRWIKIGESAYSFSRCYFRTWRIVKLIGEDLHELYRKNLNDAV